MFPNTNLLLLFISCLLSKASSDLVSRSFAEGNLDLLFTRSFDIVAYSDIDPKYEVNVPNNGLGSGGAFLFDSTQNTPISEYLEFESINKIVHIRISYFCDKYNSELNILIGRTPVYTILCGGDDASVGEAGKWTMTELTYACDPWDGADQCNKLMVQGKGLAEGGAVGVEYIIVATDDSTLPPLEPTVEPTTEPEPITTPVPNY
ncbi:unnamed protein product, partial [Meganyctiphanes norvegica]